MLFLKRLHFSVANLHLFSIDGYGEEK